MNFLLTLLIESIDAILSLIIIGFILAKVPFPWSFVLITIFILPFTIGFLRSLNKQSKI